MADTDKATLEFFRAATTAVTLEELTQSFAHAAEAAGYVRGVCYHVATPGKPLSPRYLFGWGVEAWTNHYVTRRYTRYDPTFQAIFTSPGAVTWDEIAGRITSKKEMEVFEEARAFDHQGGLVVPIHAPMGEVMAVTLFADTSFTIDEQARRNMQVAATIFANRGLSLAEIEREEVSDPGLTRREIQCVYWVNEGKTDWEIGRILSISEDTVAFHLKNIKQKLGVARRSQIPISAWLRGVLLDERL